MKVIKISVELSPNEYDILQKLSQDCNISKTEYLRLIIQGIHLGEQIVKGENQVEFGGYGYSFKPDEMESLFQEISEKLQKAIVVTPTIGEKRVRYKRIKTANKVS